MLFNRRVKPSLGARIKAFFLPRTGWKRSARYIGHRVARLPGTPASIATGFACGAASAMTPLMGIHIVFAALISWMLGGNMIASAIGTAIGNPWTFPVIWVGTYELGSMILGSQAQGEAVNFALLFGHMVRALVHLDGAAFMADVMPVLLPMLVGSLPLAILAWIITYWPVKRAVAGYQHARVLRRHRKARIREEKLAAAEGGVPLSRQQP
ncbi:DUF2062 domain-containing protein [Rhodospirillum rubrum]|uniref:Conserved hypothetical transmembrane protein n=1 Tax=Rhodospirillum rubrum (strain ATCC 11170 / ATH 1.1.1 / DSM 467 / LMG 4362 / NCIMB 8255 / S1) TaxID=269796 RepID=Q2RT90_RHORT|nr:DUF2062 domain-containing protein [Rhodospirillum rubrum]ABC22655.1 conserved hypothetical transmembrane protein [Rhodospirillum rubrum ATCC 11170]AEO48373.1 hypothetical protein F11_09535 [Rhodospirillum rubrum F11]MBK5954252.1 hypothetical protein [Rhodospirillum rubrum]QXG82277.1 DUF2062 domain-containing protein [Rhodospirillum rubrum]HAQ01419.1 DUF2062 domain-containing protein [Rhodospirillum rubrum]